MKFQDWQSCIMLNFGDLGLILATFGYFWHIFDPGDLQAPENCYKAMLTYQFELFLSIHVAVRVYQV